MTCVLDQDYEASRARAAHASRLAPSDVILDPPSDCDAATDLPWDSSAKTPSQPTLLSAPRGPRRARAPRMPEPGDRVGDFQLFSVVGQGALGTVFLAEQVSLGRRVALKVSSAVGHEARTLARLEHDHIVRVFSDRIDFERGLRLTSMQLVCGATLEQIGRELRRCDRDQWSGRAILEIVDRLAPAQAVLDPSALASREAFASYSFVEAVCWIGARLAEALDHAHKAGVVHRDVKPGNVILSQYARPMLLDFNLAADASHGGDDLFGGTLPYMPPEHLEAFAGLSDGGPNVVDERSDVFSLAAVLYELLAGRRPFPAGENERDPARLVEQRREGAPLLATLQNDVPDSLDRELRRALSPDPACRHENAASLAGALERCREMAAVEAALPAPGPLTRATRRAPVSMLFLLAAAPNVAASVATHAHLVHTVPDALSPPQWATFVRVAVGYNATVYPITLLAAAWWAWPVAKRWRSVRSGQLSPGEINRVRRRALSFTPAVIALSVFGYVSGLAAYCLGMRLAAGPVPSSVLYGFGLSFAFSGLFAGTMAAFASEFAVLRVLYPQLWPTGGSIIKTASTELRSHAARLRRLQVYSCCFPLLAAFLILRLTPIGAVDGASDSLRMMLMLLLLTSIAAQALGMTFSAWLTRVVSVLKGHA